MKRNEPKEFQRAVEFDRKIRNISFQRFKYPAFVHRSCVPLDQVDFEALVAKKERGGLEGFVNECEGMCGV